MYVKTRFAPSPTGGLHIGGVRTALYSWLFARKYDGLFSLRIEDTDSKRYIPESTKEILNVLKWLGLNWDEGPIFQSARLHRYRNIIQFMLKNGTAYKCYCTKERLAITRNKQLTNKEKPRYDRRCRDIFKCYKSNVPFVIRFKNPINGIITFNDAVRGLISFDNQELDDLIIQRIDGFPTYNLCVVVDDMDMNITHVIRGEDHINNTPRQINIFKALDSFIPQYAHISMIMDKNKQKLSKRSNANNVMQYFKQGFLKEAMLNYVVKLGWGYKNQEIFSLQEMISYFSLQDMTKSSSMFDFNKLTWLNRYYINTLPDVKITEYLKIYFNEDNIDIHKGPNLLQLVELFKKRCSTLQDFVISSRYLYEEFNHCNSDISRKYLKFSAVEPLTKVFKKIFLMTYWDDLHIKQILKNVMRELNVNFKCLGMPLRVAITGKDVSPSIDKIIFFVGRSRSLFRIKKAINYIFYFNNKTHF